MATNQPAYTIGPIPLLSTSSDSQIADINNHGDIVGTDGGQSGFLIHDGRATYINVPGARLTTAEAINDRGDIVGDYVTEAGDVHGYLYSHGAFTLLDIPGADYTSVRGINNAGQIVAFAPNSEPGVPQGGFLYEKGVFTHLDVPGQPDAFLVPNAINDHGVIVGESDNRGFVLDHGRLTWLDNPFSEFFIRPDDVNNRGEVVGTLSQAARVTAGFVHEDGHITQVAVPSDSVEPYRWTTAGVNDAGTIVGNIENRALNDVPSGYPYDYAYIGTPKHDAPHHPAHPAVDWNELAARVQANFAATGKWFVPDDIGPPAPAHPAVDWNALAAQVEANHAATGKWFL